jgi:hypothetical protein
MSGVIFTEQTGKRVLRATAKIEGIPSGQHVAPPRNPRHPRRETPQAGQVIIFEIDDDYATAGAENYSELCEDQPNDAPSSAMAQVKHRPCGVFTVQLEDEDGYVRVYDELGFLDNRNAVDVQGKRGTATLFEFGTPEEPECRWVITWINWFEAQQVEKDTIYGDLTITHERMNAWLWNHCDLPDEVIEGTDCEDGYGDGY